MKVSRETSLSCENEAATVPYPIGTVACRDVPPATGGASRSSQTLPGPTPPSTVPDPSSDRAPQEEALRSTRRRSWALSATMIVDRLISTAPTAGASTIPTGASTPAASGTATTL